MSDKLLFLQGYIFGFAFLVTDGMSLLHNILIFSLASELGRSVSIDAYGIQIAQFICSIVMIACYVSNLARSPVACT